MIGNFSDIPILSHGGVIGIRLFLIGGLVVFPGVRRLGELVTLISCAKGR